MKEILAQPAAWYKMSMCRIMKNQNGDNLPLSYWLSLVKRDIKYHGFKRHNPAAMVRSIWQTLIHRDNVQKCIDCGRRYPIWVVSDYLWTLVIGDRHAVSGVCPGCLDVRAENKGVYLIWVPEETHLSTICKRIGAFQ